METGVLPTHSARMAMSRCSGLGALQSGSGIAVLEQHSQHIPEMPGSPTSLCIFLSGLEQNLWDLGKPAGNTGSIS